MMRKLGATLFALAIATPVSGAEISRPAVSGVASVDRTESIFDWRGLYAGVGASWSSSQTDFAGMGLGTSRVRGDGGRFGLIAGYNFQLHDAVLGIESEFAWGDVSSSGACFGGNCASNANWQGALRGRWGYAVGPLMPYLSGGLAFGALDASSTALGNLNKVKLGWTIGAGLELALADNWSFRTEFRHTDLGSYDCGAVCAVPTKIGHVENSVWLGLTYKIGKGPGIKPPKRLE